MTAVTDRTGATDAEFQARIAAFEGADEPAEETVEKVARVIWECHPGAVPWDELSPRTPTRTEYRRLAAAAIAALPASPAPSTRAMLDVADNLDYYASKTTGGTHASGLEDAAAQIRAAVGAMPVSPAEEALRRVEALADELEQNASGFTDETSAMRLVSTAYANSASRIRAAIAAPQTGQHTTDARVDDPATAKESRSGFPGGPDRQMWTF